MTPTTLVAAVPRPARSDVVLPGLGRRADDHGEVVRDELSSLVLELVGRLGHLSLLADAATGADRSAVWPELVHYRRRLTALHQGVATAPSGDLPALAELVRAMFGLVAGVEGAVEWHSPPHAHAGPAGIGLVPATGPHDYQRDRCPVVGAYERAWGSSCVDRHRSTPPVRALAFSSGMAAMGTVLAWLADADADADADAGAGGGRPGAVLAARTGYHETRLLLGRSPLARRLRWVDHVRTDAFLDAVDRYRPSVVLLDAQANGPSLELADVASLVAGLAERASARRPITVVIDTTLLGIRAQPFATAAAGHPGIRLLTVESLTKFAQLGLDRVAAGVVVAHHAVVDVLDDWREHLGTNATASAVRQLPAPDRSRLERRWLRHEAAAGVVADVLRRRLDRLPVDVVHPGHPDHRTHELSHRLGTAGAVVAVVGPDEASLTASVQDAVAVAATRNLPLAEGTSFGFDATRLSVISPVEQPVFLRVSPGAGPVEESTAVAEVLAGALGRALRDA